MFSSKSSFYGGLTLYDLFFLISFPPSPPSCPPPSPPGTVETKILFTQPEYFLSLFILISLPFISLERREGKGFIQYNYMNSTWNTTCTCTVHNTTHACTLYSINTCTVQMLVQCIYICTVQIYAQYKCLYSTVQNSSNASTVQIHVQYKYLYGKNACKLLILVQYIYMIYYTYLYN